MSDVAVVSPISASALIEARQLSVVSLQEMSSAWQTSLHPALVSAPLYSVSSSSGGDSGINVPAELRAYGNGRIPREALDTIGIGQHRLARVAAAAFRSMRAEAQAAGVDIGVTDSYRSYDQQADLVSRKGLYSQGGWAAAPGTSNHGWGLALDVDVDAQGLAWLRANAGRYGFVEAVPREPWHWEYHG